MTMRVDVHINEINDEGHGWVQYPRDLGEIVEANAIPSQPRPYDTPAAAAAVVGRAASSAGLVVPMSDGEATWFPPHSIAKIDVKSE